MNQRKMHPGSLVLMTLFVMTVLVIIVHSMLSTSAYSALLAHEREVLELKNQKTG